MKTCHRWILGASLVLLVVAGVGMKAILGSEVVRYTTDQVSKQDLRESVTANGEIQARTRVNVGTSVTAEIKEIHVKDGQWVKAGDLLVTLDQERYRQELTRSQLALQGARQEWANAGALFDKQTRTSARKEALYGQGLLSNEEYQESRLALDNASTGLQRAKVAVQQAEAQVAMAQDALSKTTLRAPMSGRVTGLKAEKGETAIAGQTNIAGAVLMVISDMSELLAEMKVGELEVVKLQPGQAAEVTVDALPGKVLQGKVFEVASSVDRSSTPSLMGGQEPQSYKVRVLLSGDSNELITLRPGMSARVAVLAGEVKGTLSVPLQALQEREEKKGDLGLMAGSRYVAFVVKQGVVEERPLKVGFTTRRAAQVLEGLQEGEVVLTGPSKALATLRNGAKVALERGRS